MSCITTLKAGSSSTITVAFADSDGAPAVPAAVLFTVRCMTNAQDIRAGVDAGTPAASMTIDITSDDNEIIDTTNEREHRRVIVTAQYGADDAKVETFDYYIGNPQR